MKISNRFQHKISANSILTIFSKNFTNQHQNASDRKYITIEPGKRSGKPCVRGMRITVYDVLSYLAAGMTIEAIIENFPELTRNDILACLAFAADAEKKVKIAV